MIFKPGEIGGVRAVAIDRRVARTRAALYDALVGLIRERDYEAIRIEDIVGRADVGRSTFYAHFRSKDELLERSLDRLRAELTEAIEEAGNGDIWEVSRTLFRHIERHRDIHSLLAGRAAGDIVDAAIAANFAEVVRPMLPASRRPGPPQELALGHMRQTLITVLGWWLDRRPGLAADEAAALFRGLVANGLAADWPELAGGTGGRVFPDQGAELSGNGREDGKVHERRGRGAPG